MSHKKYRTETNCLNCGSQVEGKFCSNCGQENLETKENFFHLAGHFIADYFHYDSKFFRSLKSLFMKPGFLTKEYWDGKRVHYIHPLRLFFFITIIFVIVTTYFYDRFGSSVKGMMKPDPELAKLDSAYLASLDDSTKIFFQNDSVKVAVLKNAKIKERRQMRKVASGMDAVFGNLKYVTFFLLPVYALLFKLLYRKKRPYYVDHLVYTMHLQSFAYCILGLIFLLPFFIPLSLDALRQISLGLIFIYIALSVHYLYKQPWWKTVLKSLLATFVLFMTTAISIIALAFLDAIFIQ